MISLASLVTTSSLWVQLINQLAYSCYLPLCFSCIYIYIYMSASPGLAGSSPLGDWWCSLPPGSSPACMFLNSCPPPLSTWALCNVQPAQAGGAVPSRKVACAFFKSSGKKETIYEPARRPRSSTSKRVRVRFWGMNRVAVKCVTSDRIEKLFLAVAYISCAASRVVHPFFNTVLNKHLFKLHQHFFLDYTTLTFHQ